MSALDASPPDSDGQATGWSYGTTVDQPLGGGAAGEASVVLPDDEGRVAGGSATARQGGSTEDGKGSSPPDGTQDEPGDSKPADEKAGEPGRQHASEGEGDTERDAPRSDRARTDDPKQKAPENKDTRRPMPGREKADDGAREGRDGPGDRQKDEKADEPPPPPPGKMPFVVVGLLLVALVGWGAYKHWGRSHAAGETQQAGRDAVPEVRTAPAKRLDDPVDLTLPGQTEAFATANIFARATGYISVRNVDIGSRVHKGDLLVHIAAPDLDQQLAQAKAQLGQVKAAEAQAYAQVNQAEANLNLAKVTLARTATLTQQGYETLQNRDNQTANEQAQQANLDSAKAGVKVAEANTVAQQATVDRLQALTGFEDVTAPFKGIVTTRNVDLGDLVNADTSSATPLFSMARDDVIRVTVQVPQNAAAGVRTGVTATVEVPSNPGESFSGTVTRSSVALLSSARTLDTEVDIPNPDGRIRPGLFVYVTLHVPRVRPEVVVPAEALIFNQHGLQVAVVEGDTARLREVKIARDFGTSVSLSEGLSGGESVVLSPPALLRDGSKVKVKPPENDKGGGATAGAPNAGGGDDTAGKADQANDKGTGAGQPVDGAAKPDQAGKDPSKG